MPMPAPATAGKAAVWSKHSSVNPPSNYPWTRPATHLGRRVDTACSPYAGRNGGGE